MTSTIISPAGRIASAFDPSPLDAFVGRRIAERREARGLTIEGLSDDAGVSPDVLTLVEGGALPAPEVLLYRLSQCLETSISDFFAARPTAVPQ